MPLTPQRILLANNSFEYRGGTQAWTRQMYHSLSSMADVDVFSLDAVQPEGMSPYRTGRSYDLALVNHWTTAQALKHVSIGTFVFTSHGTIPYEEIPPLGADCYVAVSEAVRDHFPYRSRVIRNPIDTDYYVKSSTVHKTPSNVAFVSNRQGDARSTVIEACDIAGLNLKIVGGSSYVDDLRPIYEWADIVIGIARVAMEALAFERNVICFDYVGFHGTATFDSLAELHASNFGGHTLGTWPQPHELAQIMLSEYDPERSLRQAIIRDHAPDHIARQYLSLYQPKTGLSIPRLIRIGPKQLMSPKISLALMSLRRYYSTPN